MTDGDLSPALRRVRQTAREVARTSIAPEAARVDREAAWPEHSMRALAEAGLLGLVVPERFGGHGLGYHALALVTEEIGRACGSSGLVYGMHCVGSMVIAVNPTADQEERYLRPIAAGSHVTTLALSEPGTGVHFYLPATSFRRDGQTLIVDGTKGFVTSGGHADSYVLSVVAEGAEMDPGSFSCLLLDGGAEGVEWDSAWNGLGMRGNSSRTARLNGVRVPAGNLLGEEGDEIWYVFEVIAPVFLVAMAATYVGIGQAALDLVTDDLKNRRYEHSGEVTGASPLLAHRLGDLWIRLARARQLLHHAAVLADARDPAARPAIFACKAEVADSVVGLVNEAMTLAGGRAYAANSTLGRLLRDARASHVMAPTTDLLKTWLGRSLLDQPLL